VSPLLRWRRRLRRWVLLGKARLFEAVGGKADSEAALCAVRYRLIAALERHEPRAVDPAPDRPWPSLWSDWEPPRRRKSEGSVPSSRI
jgi:hypothetical protein